MKKAVNTIYVLLILIFMYLPVIMVSVYSFNHGKSALLWEGISLKWYFELFKDKALIESFINSVVLAMVSTLSACVLGTLGSFALKRFKTRLSKIFSFISYLPLLTPEIIVGTAFLQIFSYLNFKFGFGTLFISHFSFCVPFVMVVVSARLESLNFDTELAARDLGASPFKAFVSITLPLIMPSVISGAALSFLMSFDDVVISFFMAGAKYTTFPVKVYSMMKVGVSPKVNALSTIILLTTVVLTVLIYNFRNKEKIK